MRSRCSSGASAEILALVEPLAQPLIKHARLHLTARESRRSGINLLEGGFVRDCMLDDAAKARSTASLAALR